MKLNRVALLIGVMSIAVFLLVVVLPFKTVLYIRSLEVASQNYLALGNTSFAGISIDKLRNQGFPGLSESGLFGRTYVVKANLVAANKVDIILTRVPFYEYIAIHRSFKNSADSIKYTDGAVTLTF